MTTATPTTPPPGGGTPPQRGGDSLLAVQEISKAFGDNLAVDRVSLTIERGALVGLIGSNGAGKTTLVNLVSGLFRVDRGRLSFEGRDITHLSVNERIRAGIARSFQLVNLFDHLSVLDNVVLTVFAREGKTRRMLSPAESDVAVHDEAHEVLRQFGLDAKAATLAIELSQGERKLLDIAVACALRPRLLFLDEPTSGVRTREKAPIMDIVTSIVRSGHFTAVIIEHDMDVVFRYSDRIVAMHQGRILADGTPDEIRANDEVTTTLLGEHVHQ